MEIVVWWEQSACVLAGSVSGGKSSEVWPLVVALSLADFCYKDRCLPLWASVSPSIKHELDEPTSLLWRLPQQISLWGRDS
jgi:hypothetical protein